MSIFSLAQIIHPLNRRSLTLASCVGNTPIFKSRELGINHLFSFFLAVLRGLWDLSSLTRD